MKKFNVILIGILVIQAILVAVMYNSGGTQTSVASSGPWLDLHRDRLDQLTIADGDGNRITLNHGSNGWTVPAKLDFPADSQRIDGLLDSLDEARAGLPVALSKDARTRFSVADDHFARHLVFKSDGKVVADLYLGDSAGSGRLYARLAGESAIQDLSFPLWRASTSVSDWLDKSYLELLPSEQKRVALPGVTLVRTGNVWQIDALDDARSPDQGKIQALLDRLRTLRWSHLAGTTADIELPADATFTMTVTPKSGEPLVYRFYKSETGDDATPGWQLTRSDSDYVFKVDDERVAPLQGASKESLSKPKPEPGADSAAGQGGKAEPATTQE